MNGRALGDQRDFVAVLFDRQLEIARLRDFFNAFAERAFVIDL